MSDRGFAAQLAEDLPPEDLRHVLAVFRDDLVRLTKLLGEAAEAADVAGFHRAAHGLAGAAGAVGAGPLEQACRLAMAQDGTRPDALLAASGDIDTLAKAVLGDLAAFIARLDAAP